MKLIALKTFAVSPKETVRRGHEFEVSDAIGKRYINMRMAEPVGGGEAPLAPSRTGGARSSSSSAQAPAPKGSPSKKPKEKPASSRSTKAGGSTRTRTPSTPATAAGGTPVAGSPRSEG
jgi:hypothetical protein